MKKCKYADRYKGVYPPRCNNGDPCEACRRIYAERQEGKDE